MILIYLFVCLQQVFMNNSSRYPGKGQPFGYLKASGSAPVVNLFIMPYNYEVLLPLIGKCILPNVVKYVNLTKHSMNIMLYVCFAETVIRNSKEIGRPGNVAPYYRTELDKYAKSVPQYYHAVCVLTTYMYNQVHANNNQVLLHIHLL